MEYLCNCRERLLTEPVPLSASRSKGCLVFQLGFPSSPDTVCLTRVYSDARGLLAVLVFWEQNSNKHPSCTSLWDCSFPISRQSALPPAQHLAFCVGMDFTDPPPASAPPPDFPLHSIIPNGINNPVRRKYVEWNRDALLSFSFFGRKMHVLYVIFSFLCDEWAVATLHL